MELKNIKKLKRKYEIDVSVSIVVVILSFFAVVLNPLFVILVFIAGGIGLVSHGKFKKLSVEFKEVHVKKIIEDEFEGLIFNPKIGMLKEVIYESGILKKEDRFASEDYISGTLKGKKFESADVHLQDVRSNGKSTTVVTVFQGRFFVIEFDKKFESDVYIMPNRSFGFSWFNTLTRIDLESIDFNNHFDVYSENSHSAFYLLKPAFMEKLVEFKKTARRVMFGFKNNQVCIALDTRVNTFDLSMFKAFDDSFIEEVKKEIHLIEDLIDLIS